MVFRIAVATLCTLLAAAPGFAKDKAIEPVSCSGVFGSDSSEAQLIAAYGQENIVTGQVDGPEGMTYLATTVFPDDPERKMEFAWFNEDERTGLSSVSLSPAQVGPGGVRIGMSVAEVVEINQAPFSIGGFWWDYGGYANIETGALTNLAGDCFLSLRFSPAEDYSEAIDPTAVSGEVQVPTDEPLLKALDVRVDTISLGYADPNYEEDPASD